MKQEATQASGQALYSRLRSRLSPAMRRALRETVAEARAAGVPLFLVGGAVRDLLLNAEHVDVDLVAEGDAIGLAQRVAGRLRARVVAHGRFGTAVVSGPGFRLDLAMARSERYTRPGALPVVEPASLSDDLARRDFTINAMALPLAPRAGEIIDRHGGQADLRRGRLRALHEVSFQDDATRVLRALKYKARLGFSLERRTREWLQRDIPYIDTISGARLRREVELIATENNVAKIVEDAERLGVWEAMDTAVSASEQSVTRRLLRVSRSHRDAALVALLQVRATPRGLSRASGRLALTRVQQNAARGLRELVRNRKGLSGLQTRPSRAVRAFDRSSIAGVEAFAALEGHSLAGRRARRYLDEWRFQKPRMTGHDVVEIGVPSGPQVGEILAALREGRLDGTFNTRADEEAMVRAYLRRRPRRRRR